LKVLSRDFTLKERILILLLCLVLVGLAYYRFVDQPVRSAITQAESQKAAIETELVAARAKLAELEKMQSEIDEVSALESFRPMPSYSNREAVNQLLNDTLGQMDYSITFSNITRNNNQVRRNISLTFTATDYKMVKQVIQSLTDAPFRCMVDNISFSSVTARNYQTAFRVNLTATFYETMVGATTTAGLPAES